MQRKNSERSSLDMVNGKAKQLVQLLEKGMEWSFKYFWGRQKLKVLE